MARRGRWTRLGVVVAAVAATSPVVALVVPLDEPPGERFVGAIVTFVAFGWWLYLPGMLAYVLALPPLVRRGSMPGRAVAVLASPMIMAVPLLALVALLLFGSRAPDGTAEAGVAGVLASLFIPALVAGAVVPLPVRPATRPATPSRPPP